MLGLFGAQCVASTFHPLLRPWFTPCIFFTVVPIDCIALTTEASTSETWQFGALTSRKATSSNIPPSLSSLYYY